jgi:carbamoyltransferase
LFDPTVPNGKDIVNQVKRREWFRPFAGTVLKENVHEWFDMAGMEESPFMMYAVDVRKEKLGVVPSITHVDDTCRVQTVTEEQNPHYYKLIQEFNKLSNVPILFNTSFNLGGDPLVETIDDALSTLRKSDLKYLYLPEVSLLLEKK